jgi:hypothetical protein
MQKSAEVDAWFEKYEHPQKKAMLHIRSTILRADERMSECIKWKTPTFMYEGNLASFNPNTKAHVSLMFHTGAKIPGEHPRLEGGGATARYMRIMDLAEARAAKAELVALVKAWCAMKEGTAESSAKRSSPAPARKAGSKPTKSLGKPKKIAAAKKTGTKKKTGENAPEKTAAKKTTGAKKKARKKVAAKKTTAKAKPRKRART